VAVVARLAAARNESADMTGDEYELDLPAYFQRIGCEAAREATRKVLGKLHLAHATQITFENLDILLGRPIRIDLASIQAKLVKAKRGGYCFEQNRLFAAVLEHLGFPVTFLAARVRYRANRVLPRTHVLLKVEVEGRPWIADVGFGTVGLLQPIPLASGGESQQFGWNYRLIEEPGGWVLQAFLENDWQSLYTFTLEPQQPIDLEMANYYVSTHPESRFVQTLIAQRSTLEARYLLRNFDLIVDRHGQATTTAVANQDDLLRVLAEKFDLHFPAGTRFRIPSLGES
jgi:N-hydroxyarylamine O-acetyltransferase